MSPESRTSREYFQRRLAELQAALPGIALAAVLSEDGLLAATHDNAQPSPIDRRAAVGASLAAVARAAAREVECGELRSLRIAAGDGALLLRPFGRPRRRLLLLVLDAHADAQRAAQAAHQVALEIEERLAPAPDPA